jgi:hypothetical protein
MHRRFFFIGLGRYGEEFDLNGDIKIFNEMIRVLKPDDIIIFLVSIKKGHPYFIFQ